MIKNIAYILILLSSFSKIYTQDFKFKIIGQITDAKYTPIPDVQIKSKNKLHEVRSKSDGTFSFEYSYNNDYYVVFNHIGYINDTLFISKRKAKKISKKGILNITIKLNEPVFKDVVIYAKKVDTVYGNKLFSIHDYLLLKNDQLLLLTYNKSLKKEAKLILTDNNQQIISSYTVPDIPKYMYEDYSGAKFVVCESKIYNVSTFKKEIKLTPIPKEDFYSFYQRIIDTINDQYYYSNFADNYPAVDFLVTSRLDSNHKVIKSVKDDFMMELYRAQYKYVSGREKLWAYRKEQETGIDKEIWIGAASFTQDFLYKPIYAPLFIKNDTVLIFDQYKNYIFKIDSDHDVVDSIPFQLKIKGNKERWEQPLIKDKVTNNIYALYNKGGYYYLKQIDLSTGKTIQTLKLSNRYVEHLTIVDNYVYYIYRPFESLQKKYLYREKITP